MPKATVLIPTHNHGKTLLYSIKSVLDQTESDFELFVVGDGVPDETREIVCSFIRRDERIRFFDNPKGQRHGELHRHHALAYAKGEIVAYISDDDLWLPHHLSTLLSLLQDANFAHVLPLYIDLEGNIRLFHGDLALSFFHKKILSGQNWIPFCNSAHTLKFYQKLPFGWRTTPLGVPTDMYMWQQFLSHPDFRGKSGTLPTTLYFPSDIRRDWTMEQRLTELNLWSEKIAQPQWREGFITQLLDYSIRDRALSEQISLASRLRNIPGMSPLINLVSKVVSYLPPP